MGPAGLGQRLGVGEGVKKKKRKGAHIFKIDLLQGKSEEGVGGAFMVAPTVRNGEGGVEGQTEELKKKKNTVHFKGKCEGEMISGARTVRRGGRGGRKESSGATGGQRRRARSSKHHLISHKSLLNSSNTNSETEDRRSKGRA